MQTMFTFKKYYFIITVILLLTEIMIALFVHDTIIRPYIGDLLVVILIYSFCRTFLNVPVMKTAFCVLLFAYWVELLQYLQLIKYLNLKDSKVANVILGNSFEWIDMIAYTAGIMIVISLEHVKSKWKNIT